MTGNVQKKKYNLVTTACELSFKLRRVSRMSQEIKLVRCVIKSETRIELRIVNFSQEDGHYLKKPRINPGFLSA